MERKGNVGKHWGNNATRPVLPATDSGPKPGDFPIGSIESRAIARALVDGRVKAKGVFRVVVEHMWESGPGKLPPSLSPDVRYETEDYVFEIVHRLAW